MDQKYTGGFLFLLLCLLLSRDSWESYVTNNETLKLDSSVNPLSFQRTGNTYQNAKSLYNYKNQSAINSTSIKFDGTHQEAQLGTWFSYQDFTISLWLKPGATQIEYANVIDNNHRNYLSWVFQQWGPNPNRYIFSHNRDSTNEVILSAGVWQHVALVSVNGFFFIYLNGNLVNSRNRGAIIYNGTQFLRLGNWALDTRTWNGEMGEIRIYDVALPHEQIQKVFLGDVYDNSSNLVAHYQSFDDAQNFISDASGCDHPFTLIKSSAFHQRTVELLNKDIQLKNEQLRRESLLKKFLIGDLIALIFIGLVVFKYRQRYVRKIKEVELNARIRYEKDRIAHDLHDNIGTQLTSLSQGLNRLAKSTTIEPAKVQSLYEDANTTITELRDTIWGINKSEVKTQELVDKVNSFFWRLRQQHEDIEFEVNTHDVLSDCVLHPTQAINVFRIVQEAVNNAIKHAKSNRVQLNLTIKDKVLNLQIADHGVGFYLKHIGTHDRYGLTNLKKRAEEIGGKLTILSDVGKGTTVDVIVPNLNSLTMTKLSRDLE